MTATSKPFFSIIMPAYNSEGFIGQAIESVVKQTFSDWELVVVDDGSTDNTGRIADMYQEQDSRIRVVHQRNSGDAGSARNSALSYTNGRFVQLLDSDDLMSNNLLIESFDSWEKYKSDIIVPIMKLFEVISLLWRECG